MNILSREELLRAINTPLPDESESEEDCPAYSVDKDSDAGSSLPPVVLDEFLSLADNNVTIIGVMTNEQYSKTEKLLGKIGPIENIVRGINWVVVTFPERKHCIEALKLDGQMIENWIVAVRDGSILPTARLEIVKSEIISNANHTVHVRLPHQASTESLITKIQNFFSNTVL
jgi:hypothetical protein